MLKTDLQARPVFVWTDDHIKGTLAMYYGRLCLMRYLQYHMQEKGWLTVLSAEEIMKAISEPFVLLQGDYPHLCEPRISLYLQDVQVAGRQTRHDPHPVPCKPES